MEINRTTQFEIKLDGEEADKIESDLHKAASHFEKDISEKTEKFLGMLEQEVYRGNN